MSEQEALFALLQLQASWKSDRDRDRDRRRNAKMTNLTIGYTGVVSGMMRSMTEVHSSWLQVGHTFPTKKMLLLRIAEYANLFGVRTTIKRSDRFQVMVTAINGEHDLFLVRGSYSQSNGWKITVCVEGSGCIKEPTTPTAIAIAAPPEREDSTALLDPEEIIGDMEEGNADDSEEIDSVADSKKRKHKSPTIKSRWLATLVKLAIAEKPNISNKDMASLLKPYLNDNFLTDSLLQITRISVRAIVFGDPTENVQLLNEFCKSLESLGHGYKIITKTPRKVITKLEEIVLTEHLRKAKRDGEKMKRDQKI